MFLNKFLFVRLFNEYGIFSRVGQVRVAAVQMVVGRVESAAEAATKF